MARTSRKQNNPVHSEAPSQRVYNVGGYARLSVEDSGKPGADTIEMQMQTVREYIEGQQDLRLCCLYSDNGKTGTNFERPGFEQMMDAVRAGKIDCIVVKDLSRFGRNYLETGNYLERIFPFLGIRFIAINDNFDTLTAERSNEGYIVPLKNILNDVYSKDISRKIRPALRIKQENGEFLGTWAAYGYKLCAEDRHRIEPDEETAPVVRKIFQYRLDGYSYNRIARMLNEEGIPSPGRYHYLNGDTKYEPYAASKWFTQTVKMLLTNEVYLGHLVQGRKRSGFCEGLGTRRVPEEEWIIVRNTHAPLIDTETFEAVQKMERERKEYYNAHLGKHDGLGTTPNILRGLIYCADCKRPLVRYKCVTNKGKNRYYVYICQTHSDDPASCPKKYLHESELLKILWDELRREIELAGCMKKLVQKGQKSAESLSWERDINREKAEIQQELDKATMLYDSLFQSYTDHLMTEFEYVELKRQYKAEIEQATKRMEDLKLRQAARTRQSVANPWLNEFEQRRNETVLTEELAHALIERVEVGSDNSISITLKYRNEYESLMEYLTAMSEVISA